MRRTRLFNPPRPTDRKAFIVRHGMLRYGAILGAAVFAWVVSGEYGATLEHLRTPVGWLRLLLLIALCIGEWVIGAGWIIGTIIWHLSQRRRS